MEIKYECNPIKINGIDCTKYENGQPKLPTKFANNYKAPERIKVNGIDILHKDEVYSADLNVSLKIDMNIKKSSYTSCGDVYEYIDSIDFSIEPYGTVEGDGNLEITSWRSDQEITFYEKIEYDSCGKIYTEYNPLYTLSEISSIKETIRFSANTRGYSRDCEIYIESSSDDSPIQVSYNWIPYSGRSNNFSNWLNCNSLNRIQIATVYTSDSKKTVYIGNSKKTSSVKKRLY